MSLQGCRKRGDWGALAPHFWPNSQPYLNQGYILCPPKYYEPPPGFPDLATALHWFKKVWKVEIFIALAYDDAPESLKKFGWSRLKISFIVCEKIQVIPNEFGPLFLQLNQNVMTDVINLRILYCKLFLYHVDIKKCANQMTIRVSHFGLIEELIC